MDASGGSSHFEVVTKSSSNQGDKKTHKRVNFHSMFGFGDSLTDTGNMLISMQAQNASRMPIQGRVPYGETFFRKPVGRFSDGRLLVDLLEALSKALIFLGEIGGNDYNYAFGNFISSDRIHDLVPNVITQIKNAIQMMIESGVKYAVVQSAYPMGCIPLYKRVYANAARDAQGCLVDVNNVVHQHNVQLSQLLDNLTVYYNNTVQFIFWDAEKAFMELYTNPHQYGFTYRERPCYDISEYFLNLAMNITGVEACTDPSTYIIWDGPHPTEAMNRAVLDLFYTQGYVKPYPNFLTSNSRVIV
ncbi:hypothetical protein L7F22_015070 [Adiantum nelumboides]|nr:hypothetical protein [Adiantum nelumboides]